MTFSFELKTSRSESRLKPDTNMKCKGIELNARHHYINCLILLILRRLRQLGTPISSHFPSECALSTSLRVGAARSCMLRFDAPNRIVLKTFIKT